MMENISKNLIDQDEYPMTRTSVLRPTYNTKLIGGQQRLSTHVAFLFLPTSGMRRPLNRLLVRRLPVPLRLSSSEVWP